MPKSRSGVVRGGLRLGIAAVTVLVLLPFASRLPGLADFLTNPFSSERDERSEATVLTALGDLSEYRAARAEMQVIVEIEDDTRYLPDFVSGETTTFLATGTVDAYVDLSGIGAGAVEVGEDGAVAVTLPAARVADPVIDHEASRIVDRDRGVLTRIGDALTANPTDDSDLYALATEKLEASAERTELVARAERNTESLVRDLLRDAGYDDVQVHFALPDDEAA